MSNRFRNWRFWGGGQKAYTAKAVGKIINGSDVPDHQCRDRDAGRFGEKDRPGKLVLAKRRRVTKRPGIRA